MSDEIDPIIVEEDDPLVLSACRLALAAGAYKHRHSGDKGYRHEPIPSLPGSWWACEWPEKPNDEDCLFDDGCPSCNLALEAALRRMPPDKVLWHRRPGASRPERMLAIEARILNSRKLPSPVVDVG